MMALAYLSDEKGVQKEFIVEKRTGMPEFSDIDQLLVEAADKRMDTSHSQDVCAAVFLAYHGTLPNVDRSFRRRLRLLEAALAGLEASQYTWATRVRPALLHLKGCFSAFAGDFRNAQKSFEEAVATLRRDTSSLLWPADPDGIASEGSSVRQIMIATIEVDIGRCSLYQQPPNYPKAKQHLERFITSVPPDTHYFAQAHYELARSLFQEKMESQRTKHSRLGRHAFAIVVERAKCLVESAETMTVNMPILKPLDGDECSMINDVKGLLAMHDFASKSKDKAASSSVPHDACWMCGGKSGGGEKLRLCGGCKVAQYCSKDCQCKHWSHHKRACKAAKKQSNTE